MRNIYISFVIHNRRLHQNRSHILTIVNLPSNNYNRIFLSGLNGQCGLMGMDMGSGNSVTDKKKLKKVKNYYLM